MDGCGRGPGGDDHRFGRGRVGGSAATGGGISGRTLRANRAGKCRPRRSCLCTIRTSARKIPGLERSEDHVRSAGDGHLMRPRTLVGKNFGILACARMAVLALTALAGAAAVSPAHAVLDIDINRGSVRPLPIALPAFVGGAADAQLGVDVASVIAADLG